METKEVAVAKPKSHTKTKIAIFLIIIGLIVCCFSIIVFAWYGGYAKSFLCRSVTTDSVIFEKLECKAVANVSNTENNYLLNSGTTSNNIEQNDANNDESVTAVVERVQNAVVGIGVVVENGSNNSVIGTGFLISDAGLLVTNRHVVESESSQYYVVFKGVSEPVEINKNDIYRDPINDIALVKIPVTSIPSGVKGISIGDSSTLKLGETVIAIGNPLGEFTGTVTKGIISGLNREVTISEGFFTNSNQVYQDVIQTDAAINPGNSGGPLLNSKGEVIGVNFATIKDASNLSFALPINRIKSRVAELNQYGKFKIPYMGVEYRTKVIFLNKQSVVGAEVVSVIKNSPAANAGIQTGDIIVSFDGKDLSENNLSSLIQTSKIGEKVTLDIMRQKVQQEITVEIGER